MTNECYIGHTINFLKRFTQHEFHLKNKTHFNSKLQSSWDLYGKEAFEFYIIEHCPENKLLEREIYHIKNLRPYFNIMDYSKSIEQKLEIPKRRRGAKKGVKWTSERRDKIVKSLMGNQLSRKINIWPHKDGYKCKCRECRDKKNERTRISVAKNKGLCL